ncbi:MAG: hypothetical protein ACK5IC_06455 [Moheibacter sp.]
MACLQNVEIEKLLPTLKTQRKMYFPFQHSNNTNNIFFFQLKNKKMPIFRVLKMGCLKLTYQTTKPQLKVVHRRHSREEKCVQWWYSVDPLAEQTMTPYQYTYQNPVRYIDPTGMSGEDWVKGQNGKMIYDERVKDQATAEKYYAGSEYYGYGQEKNSDGTTTTYGGNGNKLTSRNGKLISQSTQNDTPEKASVLIQNYIAVNADGEWILNKVSEGYVSKYKDAKDGWVGAVESNVLAIDGNNYTEYGGISGLAAFGKAHPGYRNLDNEKLGYETLVILGDVTQKSGSAIEFISASLAPYTAGATTPGVTLGLGMQATGLGTKIYGNAKLGKTDKIWRDILMTAVMKGAKPVYKKFK